MYPMRKAISSTQATRTPWRSSSVLTYCPAANREAGVPVSNQAKPRPSSTSRAPLLDVGGVDVGDLQFTTRGGADVLGDVHHVVVIEVEARDDPIGAGEPRFLLDGEELAFPVGLTDSVPRRIVDRIAEEHATVDVAHAALQQGVEALPVEDVVSQDKRHQLVPYVVRANQEGVGDTPREILVRVGQFQSQMGAVTEQFSKLPEVTRGGDDQNLAYIGRHEC